MMPNAMTIHFFLLSLILLDRRTAPKITVNTIENALTVAFEYRSGALRSVTISFLKDSDGHKVSSSLSALTLACILRCISFSSSSLIFFPLLFNSFVAAVSASGVYFSKLLI